MTPFDHCVITASDESQAAAFRSLLDRRIQHGLYPREIEFHVYPDPPGRVGSGGGTLWALHRLYEDLGIDPLFGLGKADAPSVLVLHAAGESRRLPVYAPEGKLFAPLPVPSSSVLPPVVLDLQLSLYLRWPWQPGMAVVGSGDVIIDFDTESMPPITAPITGFATAASLEQGSRHGVFAFDSDLRHLTNYLQKEPVEVLASRARLEGTESCALDIGIVAMTAQYQQAFFALASETMDGMHSLLDRVRAGDAKFGLYLEQLTASLSEVTEDEYFARLSGRTTLEPEEQRSFYRHLHTLRLGGQIARDCTFLHFGSIREFPAAAAALRAGSVRPFYSSFDTDEISPSVSAGSFIVEGVNEPLPFDVPDGFCIDVRVVEDRRYVAVYHANDSFGPCPPNEARFCDTVLVDWLEARDLSSEYDLGDDEIDLRDLPLFVESKDLEAARTYLTSPDDAAVWRANYPVASRVSLSWLNEHTDPVSRDATRTSHRASMLASSLRSATGWRTISGDDLGLALESGLEPTVLENQIAGTGDELLRRYRTTTLAHATSAAATHDTPRILSFVEPGRWQARHRGIKRDQIVWARSPIRFDLGGGWSDTPPYTNLFGGAVTNIAADLNGQPPIQVFVRPIAEPQVVFHSIDLGARETVSNSRSLRNYAEPSSGFALPRAACVLLGLAESDLESGLKDLGGGFEISLLAAVPKGSGLGTSSVLGGVILAALLRYFGIAYSLDDLFLGVLELEQMLTTGGGWQDQIGGLAGGVKYIESRPGMHPHPLVHQLDPAMFEDPEYAGRVTVYYTGVTRLAKNILQQVVNRVNLREPAYLFTHQVLVSLAIEARRAVELRDYDSLCRVIRGSWKANNLIHESTSNDEIEALLAETSQHWSAAKLLGAGGGGYAMFMSDSVQSADRLKERLASRSSASDVARLVDFSLSRTGLEVSVS